MWIYLSNAKVLKEDIGTLNLPNPLLFVPPILFNDNSDFTQDSEGNASPATVTSFDQGPKLLTPPPSDYDQLDLDVNLNIDLKYKFIAEIKGSIEIDLNLIDDEKYRFDLIEKVCVRKYYFNPKYFHFDIYNRKLITLDNRITINLNFVKLPDLRIIFLIASVVQLRIINIIEEPEMEKYLDLICNICNLKWKISFKRFAFRYVHYKDGRLVESIVIDVSDQEFDTFYNHLVFRLIGNYKRGNTDTT